MGDGCLAGLELDWLVLSPAVGVVGLVWFVGRGGSEQVELEVGNSVMCVWEVHRVIPRIVTIWFGTRCTVDFGRR